jgi:hypothetical protein
MILHCFTSIARAQPRLKIGTQSLQWQEDENAGDDATLNVAAHRLEGLIHDRRNMLTKKPAIVSAA